MSKENNNLIPLLPSKQLAEIIGPAPLIREKAIEKVWEYIKKNELQNPKNKRQIIADTKLKLIFNGKDEIIMFELSGLIDKHLKKE